MDDEKNPSVPPNNDDLPVVQKRQREGTAVNHSKPCAEPGCDKWANGRGPKKEFCRTHGGGKPCEFPGCTKKALNDAPGKFCATHGGGNRCQHESGCTKQAVSGRMCIVHGSIEMELVWRIKRNKALRAKWLDVILEKQGGMCANPNKHCYEVVDGAAESYCRWGNDPLMKEMAQLDHKTPLFQGGTDDEANLQVLCACCHAFKSFQEAKEREARYSTLGL